MAYDPDLAGCFDETSLKFASNQATCDHAFLWLAKLREQEAVWADVEAQIEEYLRERGCLGLPRSRSGGQSTADARSLALRIARMTHQALCRLGLIPRGLSRFRLKVMPSNERLRPYCWVIFDEEKDCCIRRSSEHYRTPGQAWEVGSSFMTGMDRRTVR